MLKLSNKLLIVFIVFTMVSTFFISGCSRVKTASLIGDLSENFSSVSELKETAAVIIEANIIDQETIVYKGLPFTISRVMILSTIKGNVKVGEEIKVIETGGRYKQTGENPKEKKGEEIEVNFEGIRVMQPSEHFILFLREFVGPQLEGGYVPLGVYQGKFKINKNNNVEKQSPKNHVFKDYEKILSKERFIEKIK